MENCCEWIAPSYGLSDVVNETKTCIKKYFKTPVPGWENVGAEVPIEMDGIEGVSGDVTGYVDSIRDYPEGGLAVLDYKTTYETKPIEESSQLLLYARACQARFSDEITHAGYVYVGEAGPEIQLFEVTQLETYWDTLLEDHPNGRHFII